MLAILTRRQDHFYVCQGHLKDKGFATPIIDEAEVMAKRKKEEMDREIAVIKKEYDEKMKKKNKGKGKDEKDKEKGKSDTSKEKDAEEDEDEAQKEKDAKVCLLAAILSPTLSNRLTRSKPSLASSPCLPVTMYHGYMHYRSMTQSVHLSSIMNPLN